MGSWRYFCVLHFVSKVITFRVTITFCGKKLFHFALLLHFVSLITINMWRRTKPNLPPKAPRENRRNAPAREQMRLFASNTNTCRVSSGMVAQKNRKIGISGL